MLTHLQVEKELLDSLVNLVGGFYVSHGDIQEMELETIRKIGSGVGRAETLRISDHFSKMSSRIFGEYEGDRFTVSCKFLTRGPFRSAGAGGKCFPPLTARGTTDSHGDGGVRVNSGFVRAEASVEAGPAAAFQPVSPPWPGAASCAVSCHLPLLITDACNPPTFLLHQSP